MAKQAFLPSMQRYKKQTAKATFQKENFGSIERSRISSNKHKRNKRSYSILLEDVRNRILSRIIPPIHPASQDTNIQQSDVKLKNVLDY